MLGKLIALTKNGEEKESLPVVNLHFFIGSDLFCDLRINHKDIAAQHCLITSQKNKPALIRNLSRTVPTLVNSTEIGSSDVELKDSDIIAIRHKNYKWCYDSPSKPSTSSQTSFVVTSKNRKSWPLFKNKLVAVVTPQRRDEDVPLTESIQLGILQNEVLPKKRRGTIAEENISKSKSTPKVLAIKSGLRATNKQTFGKRKSSLKNAQKRSSVERTPKVLPSLNRKSVKFLDTSAPRSRLGTRGRKSSSYATPYKCTPAKQKLSVYSTPPSSLKYDKKKPIKSILKTPSSSSTTPTKEEKDEIHLTSTSGILTTPLSNTPEVNLHGSSLLENDLLQTPVKEIQPEIVMRSSKRKAAIIRSPPSTPKSVIKKRKSPEEKSIEASERAAKKLKKGPPHAIDKKKRAALLQCHRKSLTPHPVARRSGKFITSFPSSFSSRLETNSPTRIIVSPKFNNSGKSESLKLSTDLLTPTVIKYSSLGKCTDSKLIQPSTTASQEKIKPRGRKSSHKSISKTSPIVRKFTRASRAAQISNNLPQKMEATDVLSALDLSRRWPSPSQGDSSSHEVSNLSGFKKLFSVDKTLDVRELFLETNSELDNTTEKSFQSPSESHLGRVSRRSALLKGKQSADEEELMHSFQSEGAQDLPCSASLLSGSLSSFPSYSSTSRRSLSLKQGRKSTLSPKDINSSSVDQTAEAQSTGKRTTQSSDIVENVKANSFSFSRKGRRSLSIPNGSSFEKNHLMQSSESGSSDLLNITNEKHNRSVDTNHFSSPLNDTLSRSKFVDCNISQKGLNGSSSDVSVFSLGSFNSSYHKSKSDGDSLSLSQATDVNFVNEDNFLEDSVESEISGSAKGVRVITPITGKGHSKGRISLRRTVLLASTPKPGKVLSNNESLLSLDTEVDTKETSLHEISLNKLQRNRSRNLSTDVASGKLKKTMKKGKGFIAKTSTRFASLPLTTDSSVLKNLSAISTSVGDLRTSRRNKISLNESQPNLLKSSENLINNNEDSSITALGTIQSTSLSKSKIIDHSYVVQQSEQVLTSNISISSTRSSRKTEDSTIFNRTQMDKFSSSPRISSDKNNTINNINTISKDITSSSVDTSLGRRTRSSKRNLETSQLAVSTSFKKRSRSVPSLTDDLNTQAHRRSTRSRGNSIILNKTDKDSSAPSTLPDKTVSDDQDIVSPIIEASSNVGRRRRISKLSVGPDNSQLEKSIGVKKRSRSLPSLGDQVTPKQASSILEDIALPKRSGRKGFDSILLNKTPENPSSTTSTMLDKTHSVNQNNTTPIIEVSSNTSVRRSRPSKLSVSPDHSSLRKSTAKLSQSLQPSSSDQITPKQASNVVEDIGRSTRSSRKGDHNTSIGRRGRLSQLSIRSDDSQFEKSIIEKKRSRSLPSSSHDQITPKQTSSIVEDIGRPRRSSRKGDDRMLNLTNVDILSTSPSKLSGNKTVSDKPDNATPIIKISSLNVTGRRGRPSNLSVDPGNTELQKSTIAEKSSLSLTSSSIDQITPKQTSSIVEDIVRSTRTSKKGDSSININKNPKHSSSTPALPDKAVMDIQDAVTPIIKTSLNKTGRRGRSSKLSIGSDNSQLEESTYKKKRSRSLPSSSNDQITPKQTLSIVEDSRYTRSGKKGDSSIILNKTPKHSSSTPALPDKAVSDVQDAVTPIIKTSLNKTGRRGRSSKLSIGSDNSQLEESTYKKKRSRSLPSSSNDQITPKQTLSIVEDGRYTRSGKKGDSSIILNKTPKHSSSTPALPDKAVSDVQDDVTPMIKTSLNNTGRRGRSSKLSIGSDISTLEESAYKKKRSRSLPSSCNDQITPKQTLNIVEDGRSTRSGKKGDSSIILSKTPKHSSTPALPDKAVSDVQDDVTPMIKTSLNNTRRRGRSSKLSIGSDISTLEESTYKKKRSRSLPSSSNDQITPKQTLNIVEDGRSTRSGKKGDSSIILSKTPKHSSTPALPDKAVSVVQDDVTPMIKTSLNNTGRRGRSSKLSIGSDISTLEESTYKKKRSRSLPSSSNDQITPKQTLNIVEDGRSTRSGKKGDSSIILSKTPKHSSSTPALPDKAVSDVQDDVTPMIKTSLNNTGRRGRSSKLSIGSDISTMEESTYKKKRSRSLPSSSKDQITPKQTSIIVGDIGHSTRSFRKGDDSIILSNTNKDPLCTTQSTFPITIYDQQNGATPFIESSSSTTIGRRGRPSKLNVGLDNSQLEKSTTVKKRSRSLTSSGDQITPKQISNTIQVIGRFTRSSKTGDTSTVLNKTLADTSSATPSRLSHTTFSGKQESTTPIIEVSSNTSVRRGRPSKLSVSSDHSSLEKSTATKKLSQSLPSSSDDQMTLKKTSSQPRQSSRIGDDSKILNKINANTSVSSPLSLIDRTPSDEEVYGTPDISTLSAIKTSVGKRGRPSKLSGGLDNSELKSTSVKKLSQSLSYLSVKTSVGRQSIISKSCVGPDNSQLEKSIMKKRSRSLPSSIENQTTPKQTSSILESFGRLRRSSRKGDDGKILNKTLADTPSPSPSTLPDKAVSRKEDGATPNITTSSLNNKARRGRPSKLAVSTKVKNEKLSLIESNASQNLTSRTSLQIISGEPSATLSTYTPSLDHIEDISAISRRKSRKRNVEEVSPESGPLNPISFHGSSDDNISSLAKKRVKISNSDSFPVFSDNILNNKGTHFLDTNVGNSKTFGAFSSTPIVTKNPYIIDSCGEKYRSRCKFRNMQSPMGLSPITGEADSSVSNESSQISMICLRHSKCPSDIGGKSSSSNMLSINNRSHNYTDLDASKSSNCGTNSAKVTLSKKRSTSLSTQNQLPFKHQTPVTSQLPAVKEDKSPQLLPQVRKSDYSIHSLHESKKEVINVTSDMRSKTPIIKLSPGKNRTRSRKTSKNMESVKEIVAQPKPVSDSYLNKREAENSETSFQIELSSNSGRPSTDKKPTYKSIISSSKTSEQNTSLTKSPVLQRRGRPTLKGVSEIKNSTNKVLPVSQRRGRSAKNINLSPPLKNAKVTSQKMSKKKKGRKTITDKESSSSKEHEVEIIRSESDQTISENVEQKSLISIPKTRSKVAVLALKTPRKSVIISSPIVKSPSLNRRRVGKIKSENISLQSYAQRQGQSSKEVTINADTEDQNVILHSCISNKEVKRGKNKVNNSNPLQKDVNIEKQNIILLSPVKRRGRSAVNNSSSKRENLVTTVSKQEIVAASPILPKRGRPAKTQEKVNNISTKGKDLHEVTVSPNTLLLQKEGMSVKSSDSSHNKRGRPKKHPVISNETISSPSLPKKGRPAKILKSNLPVSGKRTAGKISESVEAENTSLLRGRSVVKDSDSSPNKKGKSRKNSVNNTETIASPSLTLPKRGRRAKIQESVTTVSVEKTARKTSANVADENTYLRRGRSVVKNSDSSNQKSEPKKDPVNSNQTIASTSSPKRGRSSNKVQAKVTTDSRKNPNKKGSEEIEEVQTNVRRRGRSAVKEQSSVPDKRKRTNTESESNTNFNLDSTLPKKGRSAKRKDRNDSESKENITSLPLQKRQSSVVENSNLSPVKRGKSKKNPSTKNVAITSPSSPNKGKSAKIQEAVTASVKGANNKVSKSIDDQNMLSSQRRGRSAAVKEDSLDIKGKPKEAIEKNNVAQISSLSKKGRPAILENVSPRSRGRSVASKQTSTQLSSQATAEKTSKLPGRRGNLASSPKPEIRKVSDRSKVIKKNSKVKETKPLKSAIKKTLSNRLSRKSSLLGYIKPGRRKVHFNKNVGRNANSKKK